jgi:hypothetical protein
MLKKYIVRLSEPERETLEEVARKRGVAAQRARRARILLKADGEGPGWTDARIAEAFDCRTQTVENIRESQNHRGVRDRAQRQTQEPRPAQGSQRRAGGQDHRVAAGRAAPRVFQLDPAPASRAGGDTGNCALGELRDLAPDAKKNRFTPRKIEYWVIPPKSDAEFAASLEEVLELYARPHDGRYPVVCLDEQPIQLLKETRQPLAGTKTHPRRVDYEYERAGTVSIFMFCEPLSGWRHVSVRERRTKVDWAQEVEQLLHTRYPGVEKVILVSDNLNTHTKGAFYETYAPEKARGLVRKVEFCHTPKHGSWLNIAESELSAMTRQCIAGRRFATVEELRAETTAWSAQGKARQKGVDWQFKVDEARVKLKSIYPKSYV